MLGMVGASQGLLAKQDYRDNTFEQLVAKIEMYKSQLSNQSYMNAYQASEIVRLRKELETSRNDAAFIKPEGPSAYEKALREENRILRQDLRSAREQLMSLRNLLKDFDNTPVNIPNHDLGIEHSPAPKVMNEELLKRLREEERQKARQGHRDRIYRDLEKWVADANRRAARERLARHSKDWLQNEMGKERDPSEMAEKYIHDQHGPAQPPQTPDENVNSFVNSIMPKGC